MYYPAPGHQLIKVVVPRATLPDVARYPAPRPLPPAPVAPVVSQALDAVFGMRDPASLTSRLFATGVQRHVAAKRRLKMPVGPVAVLSSHAQGKGECFGTVEVGGRRYAWAARVDGGRLVSFKVL